MNEKEEKIVNILINAHLEIEEIYRDVNPQKFARILGGGFGVMIAHYGQKFPEDKSPLYMAEIVKCIISFLKSTGVSISVIDADAIDDKPTAPPHTLN